MAGIIRRRPGLSMHRNQPQMCHAAVRMDSFPIVRRPAPGMSTPVLVSVPRYGTQALPDITSDDYTEPWFETFAYGFADTFVGRPLRRSARAWGHRPGHALLAHVRRRQPPSRRLRGRRVRSRRGVVRLPPMRDVPIFARPLGLADLEARLQTLYDPYYATLERLLAELHQAFGYALVLDGHTGSPRRMSDHQVIIGTRRRHLRARAAGGRGLHPSRLRGPPERQRLHRRQHRGHLRPATRGGSALQLEVNASLLMTTSREEFIAQVSRGGIPKAEANIARVRACLREAVESLSTVLAGGPSSPR